MTTLKKASFMVVLLFLALDLPWSTRIYPVRASSVIYIRSNGNVEPSIAPISTFDQVTYRFTADVYGEIVVERNEVVIDGAGYILQGVGTLNSTGLFLSGVSDVQVRNTQITGFFSAIKAEWSSDIEVTENNLTNNDFGIWLHESTRVSITANRIQGGWSGINLEWSRNNDVNENKVMDSEHGVLLHWSSGNDVLNNVLTDDGYGISLAWSSNNRIEGNSVTNVVDRGSCGVRLHSSANNTVAENQITNALYGVKMLYESVGNLLISNNASGNVYGIYASYASNNIIYHNVLVDNTHPVKSYKSLNVWDNGYPSGGNYWDSYKGIDEKSGPDQDQLGNDGIGDTPYVIDENNSDLYPLIGTIQESPSLIDSGLLYLFLAVGIVALAGSVALLDRRRRKHKAPERDQFSRQ